MTFCFPGSPMPWPILQRLCYVKYPIHRRESIVSGILDVIYQERCPRHLLTERKLSLTLTLVNFRSLRWIESTTRSAIRAVARLRVSRWGRRNGSLVSARNCDTRTSVQRALAQVAPRGAIRFRMRGPREVRQENPRP